MTFIRTDEEVALNDLLVASRETVDHYQHAIEFFKELQLASILRTIVQQREALMVRIEDAIRALGDLPSVPDPDKETGQMLLQQISAAISADTAAEILKQRVEAEKHLLELVDACRATSLAQSQAALLDDMDDHITECEDQLCIQIKSSST